MELRDALSAKYGTDMPPTLTFDHPTVSAIAAHLAESLQPSEHIDQVLGTSAIPFTQLSPCLSMHSSWIDVTHVPGPHQLFRMWTEC